MPVALLTGASGGFGQAIAAELSRSGYALVLCGRNQDKLAALAAQLPSPATICLFDVRNPAACTAALAALPPAFQTVDVLINNAGLALGTQPAHETELADWHTMIDANCKGLVTLTRLLLPGMVARNTGHIINIGSTAGSYPYPGGHVYCASKAFVKQFSLALRADLFTTAVRVTNLEPGMAQTDFSLVRFKGDAAKAAQVYANTTPLQPQDIAHTVLWALQQPAHVNINRIEMMPITQAPGPLSVKRG